MTAPAPPTRKRDAAATRAAIIDAGQQAFSTLGYAQSGIRDIAGRAGVNSALITRYFGSKAGLFAAALADAMPTPVIFTGERSQLGRTLAAQFIRPDVKILPPAMIALAAGDKDASAIAADVCERLAIAPLAQWLGGRDAHARATQIFMLATSFILYSRHIPVGPMKPSIDDTMVDWFADQVQRIVDQID